ncbi:ABC transporter ATP-binding protein [Pseudochelatococcus lubricantis]|uniref:ABC transporter ATP-binding protein n=1 Tax=Pseudochelatococcus lubricantis TaxID=1538102 RepID=UPI0036371926
MSWAPWISGRGGKITNRVAPWLELLAPYRGAALLLLLCQVGQSVAVLLLPSLSADIIDRGILSGDHAYILRMSVVMLGAAAVQILFATGTAWLGARIAIGFGRDLRSAVFARVQNFSLTELRAFGAPSLITRTTNDVQQLQAMLVMLLTMVMTAPIMGVGAVVMAIRQDTHLSLLLLVSVPVLGIVVGVLTVRSVPLFSRMQVQIDRVNQILREQITGLRVIRAFVRDTHERERFAGANDALTDTALRVGRLMALNMPAANIVMQLSSIAMVWFAAHRIAAGAMEVGSLVAFISYIAQVLISVMIASMLFAMAPRALVSGRRIREVLQTVPSVAEPAVPKPLAAPALQRGEIAFVDVSFAYPGAQAPVLRDVSFRIGPGETVAVIGATGAGKSTLVNLIPRLFDVSAGSVLVNGVDVRDLELATLWSLIGLVPQESFLFSGTVADNLRYGRAEADDGDLWHALEIAQAKDFVAALPQGLQAPVAQGGGNFSGGQRQRLTIARALVRRPSIYLFDDSFSALDYTTDARLRAALARETGPEAATLIVGQRVSSLRHANRILVLDRGTIIGTGSHDELMADCAAYREIVASQQRAGEASS